MIDGWSRRKYLGIAALARLGITDLHRRSYAPVAAVGGREAPGTAY